MGTRGPAPKPDALRVIQGGRDRRPADLGDGVHPAVEVPSIPKHLGREARKEWKRVTPHLEALGLISQIDRAALAMYCQAYGRMVELDTAFARKVSALVVAEDLDYYDAVARVSVESTPSGYRQMSALAGMIRSLREEVLKYLAQFGLSPSSRSRVIASRDNGQLGLPGVTDPVADKLSRLRSV